MTNNEYIESMNYIHLVLQTFANQYKESPAIHVALANECSKHYKIVLEALNNKQTTEEVS